LDCGSYFSTCYLFRPYLIFHVTDSVFVSGCIRIHLRSYQGNSELTFKPVRFIEIWLHVVSLFLLNFHEDHAHLYFYAQKYFLKYDYRCLLLNTIRYNLGTNPEVHESRIVSAGRPCTAISYRLFFFSVLYISSEKRPHFSSLISKLHHFTS